MKGKDLFDVFDKFGKLCLPAREIAFANIPWAEHPIFKGVALKHIVTAAQTDGKFSFHLVRLAPNAKIGVHVHDPQLETHEVIAGSGTAVNDGTAIAYAPGVISIFPPNAPHEVTAGADGLYLFAKFIPALN